MGIKLVTSESAIHDAILKEMDRVNRLTLRALSYLGEKCVIEARDRSPEESWIDRTGNLRSSIGYVIASEGKIIKYSDFTVVKNGSEGPETGKTLAEEIARKYRSGYALVVVAYELCRIRGSNGQQGCACVRRAVRTTAVAKYNAET